MRMPFGKHRGRAVADLPDDYLNWLSSRSDLREPLKSAVENELGARERTQGAPLASSCPAPEVAEALIGAGLKVLAKRAHPDTGGSDEKMREVNAAADWLRRVSRGVSV